MKNVTWDLMLKKAYIDGPQCHGGESVVDSAWSSDQEKKTYTDGIINDPNGKGEHILILHSPITLLILLILLLFFIVTFIVGLLVYAPLGLSCFCLFVFLLFFFSK